jgi:hypothetical protein
MKAALNTSATCSAGDEQYKDFYWSGTGRRRTPRVQYDYRHTNGKLFATIAPNLEEARRRRDVWLAKNGWTL